MMLQGQSRMSNESWYADHLVSEETHAKVSDLINYLAESRGRDWTCKCRIR